MVHDSLDQDFSFVALIHAEKMGKNGAILGNLSRKQKYIRCFYTPQWIERQGLRSIGWIINMILIFEIDTSDLSFC